LEARTHVAAGSSEGGKNYWRGEESSHSEAWNVSAAHPPFCSSAWTP